MDQMILSLDSTTKVNLDDNYNSKYIPVKKTWQRTFHWRGEDIFGRKNVALQNIS